jgi:hypothetical protein
MDIRSYLAEGAVLEARATDGPWTEGRFGGQCHLNHKSEDGLHPGPPHCKYDTQLFKGYGSGIVSAAAEAQVIGADYDGVSISPWDSAFIADARERLPRYRKMLEAVLLACEKMKNDAYTTSVDNEWIVAEKLLAAINSLNPAVDSNSKLC